MNANIQKTVLILIILFIQCSLTKGQVTIGSENPPQKYSILEVVSGGDQIGGLRVPQINDDDQRQLIQNKFTKSPELAKGLLIFNKALNELQYWNGNRWTALKELTASNGLTLKNNDIKLGGVLTKNTIINTDDNTLSVQGTKVNFFNIENTTNNKSILSVDGKNNRIGIGTTAPLAPLEVVNINGPATANFFGQVSKSPGSHVNVSFGGFRYENGVKNPMLINDKLFIGFRGLALNEDILTYTGMRAAISAVARNNFISNTLPGMALTFYTGNNNKLLTEHMRITENGTVGIGTSDPHPSALLELNSSDKGLLLPRVTLSSSSDTSSITSPAKGLVVYNTGLNRNFPLNGIMYWDQNQWLYINGVESIKPAITGGLIENTATISPNKYTAGVKYTGILTVDYLGGNNGFYSRGASYTHAGLTYTLQSGRAENAGKLVYVVEGKPTVSYPTSLDKIPIKFNGTELGKVNVGGANIVIASGYTLRNEIKVPDGITGIGSRDFTNMGGQGSIMCWRQKSSTENIYTITLPETAGYIFSFRLYGSVVYNYEKATQTAIPMYISAFKQNGTGIPKPEDNSTDTLLDIAEMTIHKALKYDNTTYSINLSVVGEAGDRVYFKIAAGSDIFVWTLSPGIPNGEFNKAAQRTSMMYWKL